MTNNTSTIHPAQQITEESTSKQNTTLDAARHYLSQGIAVTPLRPGTAIPYLDKWQLLPFPTDDDLMAWFSTGKNNIGIRTGHISNLFVVDVDMKNDKDGIASIAQLEKKHGDLPLTQKVFTPNNGEHFYFRCDPSFHIKSKTNSLADGVDVKGEGGQVAAPPSTKDGGAYLPDGDSIMRDGILDPPAWVVGLAKIPDIKEKKEYTGPVASKVFEVAKARYALESIPIGDADYEKWTDIGMGLHNDLGEEGFQLWDEWSASDGGTDEKGKPRYPGSTALWTKWNSFHGDGGISIATLYKIAQESGWKIPRGGGGGSATKPELVKDTTPVVPGIDINARPQFMVYNTWVRGPDMAVKGTPERKYAPGVWLLTTRRVKDDIFAVDKRICDPLHVEAVTRHPGGAGGYGRLLRFSRPDTINSDRVIVKGETVKWVMPMEMLAGDCVALRSELFDMGFLVDPKNRTEFVQYLQEPRAHIPTRVSVRQSGWVDESRRVFALPDASYGPDNHEVVYETSKLASNDFETSGTLDGWRSGVAKKATGNPLLMLAMSCAFAGPLLRLCHMKGGGLHFCNGSSTGKTTLLEAACSVWGGPSYMRTWRATANGLEGSALLFSDNLMALDEISQTDGETVGDVAYFITNGEGKQRATVHGTARPIARWTVFALSTGERTIVSHMKEGSKRAKVGQEIRIIDVPSERAHGVFDTLPWGMSGALFSDKLRRETHLNYGHPGREFLAKLTSEKTDIADALLKRKHAEPAFSSLNGGQEERAAMRFCIAGMAGELATHYGITGWTKGEAMRAAVSTFNLWMKGRKGGDQEAHHVVETMARFLETHGTSRFAHHLSSEKFSEEKTRDQAGWWKKDGDNMFYWLTKAGVEQVFAVGHFDFNPSIKALIDAGALIPKSDGRPQQTQRTPAGLKGVYVIDASKLH